MLRLAGFEIGLAFVFDFAAVEALDAFGILIELDCCIVSSDGYLVGEIVDSADDVLQSKTKINDRREQHNLSLLHGFVIVERRSTDGSCGSATIL